MYLLISICLKCHMNDNYINNECLKKYLGIDFEALTSPQNFFDQLKFVKNFNVLELVYIIII